MRTVAIGLVLALVAMPALAQTTDEMITNCQSDNPDISIENCT